MADGPFQQLVNQDHSNVATLPPVSPTATAGPSTDTLAFQNIDMNSTQIYGRTAAVHHLSQGSGQLPDGSSATPKALWEIECYAKYFDVNTNEVFERMRAAVMPRLRFFDIIGDKPDLYGPFWIATSVLFLMFVSGSFAKSVDRRFRNLPIEYNLENLSLAAFVLYTMVVFWPTMAWFAMKFWRPEDPTYGSEKISFLQWTCIYGYCLTVLIPFSILAVIIVPIIGNSGSFIKFWQWSLIIIAFGISTAFLVKNLWPYLGNIDYGKNQKTFFLFLLVALHAAMFLLFKVLFFSNRE